MTIPKNNLNRLIQLLSEFQSVVPWVVLYLLLLLQISPIAIAQSGNSFPTPPPNPFSRIRFDKSMAVILVTLVVVFFILGFLSVYTRQCADRRIRGPVDLEIAVDGSWRRSRRGLRGLDLEVIESFPTFVYSAVKGLLIGEDSLECAVCLNEFGEDETLRLIPKCNHVFHPDCIDVWLTSHITCPVCRANLVPKPGDNSFVAIQIPDPGNDTIEPDRRTEDGEPQNKGTSPVSDKQNREIKSPKVNLLSEGANHNRPPRSRSTGFPFTGFFSRSQSMGHSVAQPGRNRERFTLRLPEEVRSQLVNSSMSRTKSCVAFTRVSSSKRGYRSTSFGSGLRRNYSNYERFGREERPERWGFTRTPPFFTRTGSFGSPKCPVEPNTAAPSDRSALAEDNVGERSSDRLWT
ncbi:putative Ring finger protein [Quillaja saponaria]|uniref:RING-type E3 ubiquitin transferase n=1 Tax=Quillaja saponaria TaxID=32244 RepID=A0AAD7LKZ5_QUISA|nr:putative Ring finger protein [Quillaja saponaria]